MIHTYKHGPYSLISKDNVHANTTSYCPKPRTCSRTPTNQARPSVARVPVQTIQTTTSKSSRILCTMSMANTSHSFLIRLFATSNFLCILSTSSSSCASISV